MAIEFILIVKPCQGMKTFEMFKARYALEGNVRAIFITDNFMMQGDQMSERCAQYAGNTSSDRVPPVLLHMRAEHGKADGLSIAFRLLSDMNKDIVALCNKQQLSRVKDTIEAVTMFEAAKDAAPTIWQIFLDESDKTLMTFFKHLKPVLENASLTIKVYCVTATVSCQLRLWRVVGEYVVHQNAVSLDSYNFLKDATWCKEDFEADAYNDIVSLTKKGIELYRDITENDDAAPFVFAPTGPRIVDHHGTATELAKHCDACVLVINGEGYSWYDAGSDEPMLYSKHHHDHDCTCVKRAGGTVIAECTTFLCGCKTQQPIDAIIQFREKAGDKTMIITGRNCIERAATLHSMGLPFNVAVYSGHLIFGARGEAMRKSDVFKLNLYQLLARPAGCFKTDRPPIIMYNTNELMKWALDEEEISKRLAGMGGEKLSHSQHKAIRADVTGKTKRQKTDAINIISEKLCGDLTVDWTAEFATTKVVVLELQPDEIDQIRNEPDKKMGLTLIGQRVSTMQQEQR